VATVVILGGRDNERSVMLRPLPALLTASLGWCIY